MKKLTICLFCVWSNGSTRIRSEYIEEMPFSRLLRASAWHLISRESYWHFDRRSARYLVFAFSALIQLGSSEWSHERWTRTTNRIIHCFRVFNYCSLLFPRGGIRAICQSVYKSALSKILHSIFLNDSCFVVCSIKPRCEGIAKLHEIFEKSIFIATNDF